MPQSPSTRAGTWLIQARIADPAQGTATVSGPFTLVVEATPTSLVVDGPATVAAETSASFTAQVRDQFAQPLAAQPPCAWSATGGAMAAGGTFTAGVAIGAAQVRAAADGLTGLLDLTITAGTAGGGPVAPPPAAGAGTVSSQGGSSCGGGAGFAVLVLGLGLVGRTRRRRSVPPGQRI